MEIYLKSISGHSLSFVTQAFFWCNISQYLPFYRTCHFNVLKGLYSSFKNVEEWHYFRGQKYCEVAVDHDVLMYSTLPSNEVFCFPGFASCRRKCSIRSCCFSILITIRVEAVFMLVIQVLFLWIYTWCYGCLDDVFYMLMEEAWWIKHLFVVCRGDIEFYFMHMNWKCAMCLSMIIILYWNKYLELNYNKNF